MNRFCYRLYQSSLSDGLIHPGVRIIVSLSGGVDSLSLSLLLCEFRDKTDLDLHWVHFNHGLRPESAAEEDFVRNLSLEKDIPLTTVRTDQLRGQRGMQSKARRWRYEHLNRIRSEHGFDRIATGHQLNDLIETQIWRLLRGASLFSLNPISKCSPPYIRPLLHTPKSELEQYLRDQNQPWCEDSSNAENAYTRNLIRNQLIPMMQQCAGGRLEDKFLALDRDARLLAELFEQCVPPDCYQQAVLPYSEIQSRPPLLAAELIHRYLVFNGQPDTNRDNIERIHKQVANNAGNWSINLKNGTRIAGHKKTLIIQINRD